MVSIVKVYPLSTYLDHVVGISKDEGEVGLAADHPDGELGALVVGAHLAGLFTPGVM